MEKECECKLVVISYPDMELPDSLLPGIIKWTGLEEKPPSEIFNSSYTWDYSDQSEEYIKHRHLIGERVENLYYAGKVAYGSW